jgi:hypothetical protein
MKIIMWALVVIFAAWGMGSVATSRKYSAGTIFNKKISIQKYNNSYNSVLNRAKMMYGDKLPKMEKFLDLKNQAWDRLILLYAGRKRHIKATDKEVIKKIAGFPFFQQNNRFDTRLYNYIVANVFQNSPRDFEESVRGDIIIEKLMDSITEGLTITDSEIENAYRAENELANLSFILITPDNYKQQVSVKEDEIRSFYNRYKNKFLKPAAVNVDYLKIPFGDDKEEARFTADELSYENKKGKPLKDVAGEYGLELKETGDFSMNSAIPEIGLSYPFALAALRLKTNEVSGVVEAGDSFYIMQLKSKTSPAPLSYNDAKEKAEGMLVNEKAASMAKFRAEEILLEINRRPCSLEDIIKESDYELRTAKQVTRESYIKEIGPSKEFSKIAFSLNVSNTGGPAKTEKGYAIIRLDSLKPIDRTKFLEDKEGLSKKLIDEKKRESFQNWFNQYKKKANLQDRLGALRN